MKPAHTFLEDIFDKLASVAPDVRGVRRDTYGKGEQAAHDLLKSVAKELSLDIATDAGANLYMTLTGKEPGLPVVMTGSHMDSVPAGGNFDGATGVIAALEIARRWRQDNYVPDRSLVVMAIRAEESAWFPVSYIGSKAAFNLLSASDLEAKRHDNGSLLKDGISSSGGDPQALLYGQPFLKAADIHAFLELHIEQGPCLLEQSDTVIGVVTGICGSTRYRYARLHGAYAHSGATPRLFRQDSVVALSDLVTRAQAMWAEQEAQGHLFTLTFGIFSTDADLASFCKISGDVAFSIDIRSTSSETLQVIEAKLKELCLDVERKYGVSFEFGTHSGSKPAIMDETIQNEMLEAAADLSVGAQMMPSGAGHDTAIFANQGIRCGMLFVRNQNGSHCPEEFLDIADLRKAIDVFDVVLKQETSLSL